MSERAQGPIVLAGAFYEQTWHGNRSDPRLDQECLVRDPGIGWWRPGPAGHTTDEAEAGTFTPRQLFERYGPLNDDANFCFLDAPPEPVVLPPAERRESVDAARHFLAEHPERCFLVQGRSSRLWARRSLLSGEGMSEAGVNDRNQAGIFAGLEIMLSRFENINVYFEILPKEFKPPPPGKIRIERILTPKMIETLKELPNSQVIRTQIWSIIKSPIPEDKKTYDEIKTWIEENYDPKPTGLFRKPSPERPEVRADGFSVQCSLTYRVHGRCNYSATLAGSDGYNVTGRMLEAAVAKARGSDYPEDAFIDALAEALRELVAHHEPDMEESENDLYDREVNEREDQRVTISRNLQDHGRAWLRRYHPDLAQPQEGTPLEPPPTGVPTLEQVMQSWVAPAAENEEPPPAESVMGLDEDDPEDTEEP